MNKVIIVAIAAGSFMLLNSGEAAAHKELRNVYPSSSIHRIEPYRSKHMPYWLKRDTLFVRWYKRTNLKKDRFFTWRELHRIYRWEHADARRYYREVRHHPHYREQRRHVRARQPVSATKRAQRH
jgi:hypothetical protein